jgi:hypothetical protein
MTGNGFAKQGKRPILYIKKKLYSLLSLKHLLIDDKKNNGTRTE